MQVHDYIYSLVQSYKLDCKALYYPISVSLEMGSCRLPSNKIVSVARGDRLREVPALVILLGKF